MTVNPIIFNEMGDSDAGWKTTYTKDSSEGIHHADILPEKDHEGIKLRPRPVMKPVLQNGMPGNIGRPEREITEFTIRDRPEKSPVLFQPPSDSTKEFYYAPVDVAAFRESGDILPLPHEWPEESPTNYGDSDLNLEVGQDGYSKVEQDSNFSKKPETWRFRKRDNDVGLQQVHQESLPDLRDVGISEMVYPIQSGLRPIVFGATPRQRAQRKKLNRKKHQKAEAKPQEKPAESKPTVTDYPNTNFDMDVEDENEATGSGVIVVKDSKGNEILRYGIVDGKPVMEPSYEEAKNGTQWLAAMGAVLRNWGELAPEWLDSNQNLPEPPAEVMESLGGPSKFPGRKAKSSSSGSGYRGNILEDPALANLNPAMLDQEKLFTSIRKWDGDSYVITADKLDAGTKEVLAEKPQGEGHYFSWNYVTPEQSEKMAEQDVEKEGFTISPGEGVLSVKRLGGWDQVETEVMKNRRGRPA